MLMWKSLCCGGHYVPVSLFHCSLICLRICQFFFFFRIKKKIQSSYNLSACLGCKPRGTLADYVRVPHHLEHCPVGYGYMRWLGFNSTWDLLKPCDLRAKADNFIWIVGRAVTNDIRADDNSPLSGRGCEDLNQESNPTCGGRCGHNLEAPWRTLSESHIA